MRRRASVAAKPRRCRLAEGVSSRGSDAAAASIRSSGIGGAGRSTGGDPCPVEALESERISIELLEVSLTPVDTDHFRPRA